MQNPNQRKDPTTSYFDKLKVLSSLNNLEFDHSSKLNKP